MEKINDDIIQFYKENPEMFEKRKMMSMEVMEDYVKRFGMMKHAGEIFKEWEHLWVLAKSYWYFPEDDDMKRIVNKYYDPNVSPDGILQDHYQKG